MPFKRIKRAFKKVTKPVAKVLDKVVPNELKPFLPYAAAVAPYLLPAGAGAGLAGIGINNPMLQRAILTGGLNLGAQLAQEGSEGDFSALSLGLAGLQGALTAPGAAETLRGAQTVKGTPFADVALESADATLTSGGVLESAKNIGLEGLATGAEKISGIMSAAKDNPISMAGLKAAAIPFTQGSADLGMATARKALQDYEAELAAFNAQAGANQEASDSARRAAIIASMTRADFTQDIIDETLDQLGLKDGGIARLGFDNGGFEPFKFTSKIKEMWEAEGENDPLGTLVKIGLTVRAPIIDIVRTLGFTGAAAASLVGEVAKLGYDVTEPIRDVAGKGLKGTGKGIIKAVKESEDLTRFIQPMYYLERFGPEKNLTDDETRLARAKRSSRADDKDISKLESRLFGFDDAGMNQRPEDIKMSEEIKFRLDRPELFRSTGGIARLGFDNGGDVSFGGITEAVKNVEQKPIKFLVDKLEVTQEPGQSEMRAIIEAMYNDIDDVMPEDRKREFYQLYAPQMLRKGEMDETEFKFIQTEILGKKMKKGGIASLKDDGIMDLGGKEMDMRGGGFIPIGAKERADDVPARLSKNEFVMTADAVRAAGGGSVNKGAKRMYDLMHNLEARV